MIFNLPLVLLPALTDSLISCVFLAQLMKLRSYWLLAVCFGGGVGLLSALVTVLDQLLCPHGYSDVSISFIIVIFYMTQFERCSCISIRCFTQQS